jgi:hypothetical protein
MAESLATVGRAALRTLAGTLTITIAALLWLKRPDETTNFLAAYGAVMFAAVCAALGAFAFRRASTPAVIAEWAAIGSLAAVALLLIVSIGFVFSVAAAVIFLDRVTSCDDELSALPAWQHVAIPLTAFGATLAVLLGVVVS